MSGQHTSTPGALITPRLKAMVHHSLGRASASSAPAAILIGEELITMIQGELEEAYQRGRKVRGGDSTFGDITAHGGDPRPPSERVRDHG